MSGASRGMSRARSYSNDDRGRKVPVAEVMDKLGTGFAQLEMMLLAGGVFMTEGCLLVIASVIVRTLEVKWNNTIFHSMLLAVSMFIGVSVGCMVGGLNSDAYGRRPAVLVCYVGTIVMLPINAAAMHWAMLVGGNIIVGFFFGYGIPAAQALISETCSSSQRSNLVCMAAIMFAMGQMVAGIVVWIVNPYLVYEDLNWRMMMVFSMVPLLVLLPIAYFRLLESPLWLYVHGDAPGAEEVLRKIAGRNGVDYDSMHDESQAEALLRTPPMSTTGVDSKRSNDDDATWKERVKALFSSKYKGSTLILMFVCFSSNLCYYGMIYVLPETFSELMMAIEKGAEGRDKHLSPALNLMLSAVFEIPGVLLAIVLSNSVSRKISLCISFTVISISCISLVAASQHQIHAMVLTSLAAFSGKLFVASAFILCYLFVLEVYPTALRSSGLAFCMTFGRFGAFVIPVLAEVFMHHFDTSIYVFLALGTIAAIAAIVCALLPDNSGDETTDQEEFHAQEVLRGLSKDTPPLV
jgi:AAHS family benzoate transporter-like MFS transporter